MLEIKINGSEIFRPVSRKIHADCVDSLVVGQEIITMDYSLPVHRKIIAIDRESGSIYLSAPDEARETKHARELHKIGQSMRIKK